ncbi:MAG: hypothetical protein JRI95_09025 [Deltaproteobacteria bacterium]|nr:hypothetical protein [Deltaproteobacteria bacterium]
MNRSFFLFLVGAVGALALVAEVVFMRQMLVAFNGIELIIPLVLAGWLAGVFLGTAALLLIRPGVRSLKSWWTFLPLAWLLVLAFLLAYTYLAPYPEDLSRPGEAVPLSYILFKIATLTLPASFFFGALSVLAWIYLLQGDQARKKTGLAGFAAIFWIESAGSCLGLLLYALFLADRANPVQVLALMSGVMILAQAVALPKKAAGRVLLVSVVLLMGTGIYFSGLLAWLHQTAETARFTRSNPFHTLLAAKNSPYQHLALARRGEATALFHNQTLSFSWPDHQHFQVESLLFLTEAPRFDRVLLAGQGPAGFIHELLKQKVKRLVYVGLDPAATGLISDHLTPSLAQDLKDPRLTIISEDFRRYLTITTEPPFDLIVINAMSPATARSNRFYTLEFFQEVKQRLAPEGVMIASLGRLKNYWSHDELPYGRALVRTVKKTFPHVLVPPGRPHYIFAASAPGVITNDPQILARRYIRQGFDSPYLTPRALATFFPAEGLPENKALPGETAESFNTDARPLSYLMRLLLWENRPESRWTRVILRHLRKVNTWGSWAAGLLAVIFLVILIRPGQARIATWTSVITGGLGMSLLIILVFLFQNKYGTIFGQIGLLMLLYTGGLTAGGLAGWFLRITGAPPGLVLFPLGIFLSLLAAASALTVWGVLPEHIYLLIFGTGLVTSLKLSLVLTLFFGEPSEPSVVHTSAGLRLAETGGGLIGALICGLILVPVVGPGQTALTLAFIMALSSLALLRLPARG